MKDWPRIIAHGWPGAKFNTHSPSIDEGMIRTLTGNDEQKIAAYRAACHAGLATLNDGIPDKMVLEGTIVHWMDTEIPMPTKSEIEMAATQIEAELAVIDEKRAAVKQFAREWPPEKTVEYLKDPEKRAEVIAAAEAVDTKPVG